MDLDEFRRSLDDWLDQNEHDLRADPAAADTTRVSPASTGAISVSA